MTNLRTVAPQALEALCLWATGRDMDAVALNDLIHRLEAALADQNRGWYTVDEINAKFAPDQVLKPEPPPEAQTEAEKIAYCAGWWAALDKARTAEPVQKPVAWMDPNSGEVCRAHWLESHSPERDVDRFTCALYIAPPQRKPLSEEEIDNICRQPHGGADPQEWSRNFARAVERAHGIKE